MEEVHIRGRGVEVRKAEGEAQSPAPHTDPLQLREGRLRVLGLAKLHEQPALRGMLQVLLHDAELAAQPQQLRHVCTILIAIYYIKITIVGSVR